jgi:hypothetical protein
MYNCNYKSNYPPPISLTIHLDQMIERLIGVFNRRNVLWIGIDVWVEVVIRNGMYSLSFRSILDTSKFPLTREWIWSIRDERNRHWNTQFQSKPEETRWKWSQVKPFLIDLREYIENELVILTRIMVQNV